MNEDQKYTLGEADRKFAVLSNNRAWELLELEERDTVQGDELIMAGQASLYHWMRLERPVNIQRAYWMLAHIYTVLGQAEPAGRYARICQDWTALHPNEMKDFDLAYALEGLARSSALAGESTQAKEYYRLARAAGDQISDAEDSEIFERDFAGGEWFGLRDG